MLKLDVQPAGRDAVEGVLRRIIRLSFQCQVSPDLPSLSSTGKGVIFPCREGRYPQLIAGRLFLDPRMGGEGNA